MTKYGIMTDGDLAREIKKRKITKVAKPLILDPRAAPQNAFITDPARYLAAQCSRRAGKSTGLGLRFIRTMEKHPKSQSIYLGLTMESAREIMWPVMEELSDKYQLGLKFVESKLTIYHPNGAKLRLMGADMKNFIKRIKGRKYPAVAIDEAQDFSSHLQSLIDDVLTPAIADYPDGWLAVTGTPGPVPQGYFFQVTQEKKYGYSFHEWTLLENPFMPDPAGFISDICTRREWDDNNPTLLREYRNRWVLDVESLWIRYKESINHYQALPDRIVWNYTVGIDIGFNDADAIAVIAWADNHPNAYLVEETVTKKQGLTELVAQIESVQKRYNCSKMVIDEGGLGKKLAEEMRRQHSIPVHPADKARKQENVEFLNDAMRTGKFKAKSASRFAQDSYLVQVDWDKSTPDRIIIKKKPHSDIIDAVLYAFKECPIFGYIAPSKEPKYGTKEWADAQQDAMFENAQRHFEEQADAMRRDGYDD